MTYENALLGVSVHMLLYQHLPYWGTWFNRVLRALPKPLQTLYQQWECPYCCGFWIALAMHSVTGNWMFPIFADLPPVLGWFADGLAFAVICKWAILLQFAVTSPAIEGRQKQQEIIAAKAKT